jgi:hypothetical protein
MSRCGPDPPIEFEVDQHRNAVPWKVTLHRGGSEIA